MPVDEVGKAVVQLSRIGPLDLGLHHARPHTMRLGFGHPVVEGDVEVLQETLVDLVVVQVLLRAPPAGGRRRDLRVGSFTRKSMIVSATGYRSFESPPEPANSPVRRNCSSEPSSADM